MKGGEMHWNGCCFVLLSLASVLMKGGCQETVVNTPPTIWLDDRDWYIRDGEQVGTRIAQAHGDDAEGGPLTYGLEPLLFYGTKGPPGGRKKLPFRIDPETGTVYLNESLQGRAGENLHLYVTVTDGQLTAKSEVNVNILSATAPYNPSQPKRGPPRFGGPTGGFLPPVGMLPRPLSPPSQVPNYGTAATPATTQPVDAGRPHFQQKTYPEFTVKKQMNNPTTTQLKPIPIDENDSEVERAETRNTSTITASTTQVAIIKNIVDIENNDIDDEKLMAAHHPVMSSSEIPATIIPILLVCGIFLTIGIVAVMFRKKISIGKTKDSKDDMSKEPSSGGVVLQEDAGLNMHEWRGPRAFSNRYEPWQGDGNRTQITNQLSGGVKNSDRWEFPRHRLKFFNILGEGAFGQVWKCEALDLEGKDAGITVVAVKTLKENATEKERSDLISELKIMKTLDPHPNVVRLLGCCTDKEPIFLIMEFISKGKLQSYLRSSRAERYYNNMHGPSKLLTSRDLTSFVYQVAKGMEYLSSNGIIHRDLAARNVLISEEHTCKVADFGFARDVAASHVYERKSEGRLPIRWMAPESLYDNLFSVKSDVWSFGVFIWEVVTLGSTPYPGMSAADVMKKVRDGYRLDKPEHCRRELYNIMYYCWDKDPKERPSFTECITLLEKLLLTETDYIELERFPDHSYYNMMSLSGEKL